MAKLGCCYDKRCTAETCMNLPDGRTCGDCFHIKRREAIFGHVPSDTSCDWFPRRFREPSQKELLPCPTVPTVATSET